MLTFPESLSLEYESLAEGKRQRSLAELLAENNEDMWGSIPSMW